MANENFKTINTRIALRTGDYAYWTTGAGKDIELIKGEVCVCTVAAVDNQATTAPTVLFKVCDTTGKKFADLKWISALAADVYEWAKKSEAEFITWVTGLKYITVGETTYTIKEYVDLMIGELDTRVGKLADLNGNITNRESIVGAINAVRTEALNAVNAGGSGSVITVRKDNDNKYTVLQGGNEVEEAIEIADGTLTVEGKNGLTGSGTFGANQAEDGTITLSHAAKANGLANVTKAARNYVAGITFDDYGHVTAVEMGEETVVDTNTAHTHAAGDGLKLGDVKGGIEGEVKYELNLAFGELTADNKLQLLDAANNAVIAEFDAAAFVKDSFLEGASYNEDTNDLTLTFVDNSDNKQDIVVPLDDLVDVYTADETSITLTASGDGKVFKVKDGGIETKHIKDGNVTEAKLEKNVTDALGLARTALQKEDIVTGGANGTIKVDGTDVPVQGLQGAAFVTVDSLNATAKGYADDVDEKIGNLSALANRGGDGKVADYLGIIFNEIDTIFDTDLAGINETIGDPALIPEDIQNKTLVGAIKDNRDWIGSLDEEIGTEVIKEIDTGTGLKATTETRGTDRGLKTTIEIDTDVVFVLDCNW